MTSIVPGSRSTRTARGTYLPEPALRAARGGQHGLGRAEKDEGNVGILCEVDIKALQLKRVVADVLARAIDACEENDEGEEGDVSRRVRGADCCGGRGESVVKRVGRRKDVERMPSEIEARKGGSGRGKDGCEEDDGPCSSVMVSLRACDVSVTRRDARGDAERRTRTWCRSASEKGGGGGGSVLVVAAAVSAAHAGPRHGRKAPSLLGRADGRQATRPGPRSPDAAAPHAVPLPRRGSKTSRWKAYLVAAL